MRAYRHTNFNGIDGLELVEEQIPAVGPGQVSVRVHASSLNARDVLIANGQYPFTAAPGFIALSDGAGEVVEIGQGVTRFAPGDRVINSYNATWFGGKPRGIVPQYGVELDGWFAEHRVVSEQALVRMPDHLSFEEGASLPCAAVTAWSALDGVMPGDTVLTQGTGGVAVFALQLAQTLGARVVATTSSAEKAQRLRDLGAHAVINYVDTPEWSQSVQELTGGQGADRIVEVGGPGTIAQSIAALARGGEIALVGLLAPIGDGMNLIDFFLGQAKLRTVNTGTREDLEDLNRALASREVHPVIDSVFAFDEAHEAFAALAAGGHVGKTVIRH